MHDREELVAGLRLQRRDIWEVVGTEHLDGQLFIERMGDDYRCFDLSEPSVLAEAGLTAETGFARRREATDAIAACLGQPVRLRLYYAQYALPDLDCSVRRYGPRRWAVCAEFATPSVIADSIVGRVWPTRRACCEWIAERISDPVPSA